MSFYEIFFFSNIPEKHIFFFERIHNFDVLKLKT